MKYSIHIDVNLPRERVIELFDNPDNMKYWMKGLQRFEHVSGTQGQPGAKSKLTFQFGKKTMELMETITVRNLPHEFTGTYETNGTWSQTKMLFDDLGNGTTRITSENEFRMGGLMRLIGMLFPGMFKKQSMHYLKDFKHFAEEKSTIPQG